jgi:hypothetical protein
LTKIPTGLFYMNDGYPYRPWHDVCQVGGEERDIFR